MNKIKLDRQKASGPEWEGFVLFKGRIVEPGGASLLVLRRGMAYIFEVEVDEVDDLGIDSHPIEGYRRFVAGLAEVKVSEAAFVELMESEPAESENTSDPNEVVQ